MAKRVRVKKLNTYIEGMDEVTKLLQDLGDTAIDALDNASKAGADIVLAEAKQKAPVDTGTLRESLILKKSKVKNARVKSEYFITKKSGVAHFAPVELGTSKMRPQPFLRPAIDENKKRLAKKINDTLVKELRRIT